jgi:Fic family protein
MDRVVRRSVGLRHRFELTPRIIRKLHKLAIDGLYPCAGVFRDGDVEIDFADHKPPPPEDVPWYVDDMCGYINDEWGHSSSIHLGAYLMWRMNWIHAFFGGNGRTSRAVAYLVLSIHIGTPLPGINTIPDQIMKDRDAYYDALGIADRQWARGRLSVKRMERILEDMLFHQLADTATVARSNYRGRAKRRTTRRQHRKLS